MDDWEKGMNEQKKLERHSSWAWELFEGTQGTSSVTPRDKPSFGCWSRTSILDGTRPCSAKCHDCLQTRTRQGGARSPMPTDRTTPRLKHQKTWLGGGGPDAAVRSPHVGDLSRRKKMGEWPKSMTIIWSKRDYCRLFQQVSSHREQLGSAYTPGSFVARLNSEA